MFKNLRRDNKRLLVVSDTRMVLIGNKVKAFGPVVSELQNLLKFFDQITWIGFDYIFEDSSMVYITDERIKVILLDKVGGKTFWSKLKIIRYYPKMFFVVLREVLKHDLIHSRGPSNPAVISMFISFFFRDKTFWFKYAGSWVEEASKFYKLQRSILKKLLKNSVVTINGNYSPSKRIISFENPCITEENRIEGKSILETKILPNKKNYCFVGGLNLNKGVMHMLESFSKIDHDNIGEIFIVGDGPEREELEKKAHKMKYNIKFYGFQNREFIISIYKISHFIILASKSEGFPKVIGEAMTFGVVPIVSDISCIGEYVKHNKNGFLINPSSKIDLSEKIIESLRMDAGLFNSWIFNNFELSKKFTYSYYLNRIKNEIINKN